MNLQPANSFKFHPLFFHGFGSACRGEYFVSILSTFFWLQLDASVLHVHIATMNPLAPRINKSIVLSHCIDSPTQQYPTVEIFLIIYSSCYYANTSVSHSQLIIYLYLGKQFYKSVK